MPKLHTQSNLVYSGNNSKMSQAIFCFFSALAIIIVLLPLPWHWRSGNAGTLLHAFWTLTANIIRFVDAIVWQDNVDDTLAVWCDITNKLYSAVTVGIPLASLSINRRLASIALSNNSGFSAENKRKQLFLDLLLGIGIPCLYMVGSYIVQPHRYDIVQGYGCYATAWPSLPYVFLQAIWPVIFGLISGVYGLIAVHALVKQRLHFNTILRGSKTGLSTGRFIRLAALGCSDIILSVPWGVYFLYANAASIQPWLGWDNVHAGWSTVLAIRTEDFFEDPSRIILLFLARWIPVLAAFLFFAFFGLSDDSIAEYSRWWINVRDMFPRSNLTESQLPIGTLPTLGTQVKHAVSRDSNMTQKCSFDGTRDGDVRNDLANHKYLTRRGIPGILVSVQKDTVDV